jgi:hypothetical protein
MLDPVTITVSTFFGGAACWPGRVVAAVDCAKAGPPSTHVNTVSLAQVLNFTVTSPIVFVRAILFAAFDRLASFLVSRLEQET